MTYMFQQLTYPIHLVAVAIGIRLLGIIKCRPQFFFVGGSNLIRSKSFLNFGVVFPVFNSAWKFGVDVI